MTTYMPNWLTFSSPGRLIQATVALLRVFGVAGLAMALLSGVTVPVSAQPTCATHAKLAKYLEIQYSETPTAIGLASNGGVIQLFTTSEGSTWTLIITMPDGTSCAMASGQGWENFSMMKPLGPPA